MKTDGRYDKKSNVKDKVRSETRIKKEKKYTGVSKRNKVCRRSSSKPTLNIQS